MRFLTKRYIGEYDHQSETRYKHELLVDGEPVLFEICDTCPKTPDEIPSKETISWADGFILVYSITDRSSFNYVKDVSKLITDLRQMTLSVPCHNNSVQQLPSVQVQQQQAVSYVQ